MNDVTLYCCDALEMAGDLAGKADCIVTDPPYKLTSGGKNTGEMQGKFAKDQYNNSGSIVDCDITWQQVMDLCYALAADQCHVYCMANDKNIHAMLTAAGIAGFKFHNMLVWDKGNATPNRWYMKNCEFTAFFYKGQAKYINDCGSKQLMKAPQEPYGDHPTPKPVALMQHYIRNSTTEGQTVIDPFMGSGSTGVAAVKEGCKFVGIEKDVDYFVMAEERISLSANQLELFA